MGDLVIKPEAGGSIKLQNNASTNALVSDNSGNIALGGTLGVTGNTTLSGTANNLGTVTGGTISTGATIATGVHGKYVLEDYDSFAYETQTSTTTVSQTELNVSGSQYVTITTGTSTNDILEFVMDFGTVFRGCGSSAGYMGFGLVRATDTGFSAGGATVWRSGEHSLGGGAGSSNDKYNPIVITKIATVSECGFSASTTYYARMTGMVHSPAGTFRWGIQSVTNQSGTIEPTAVRMTYKRWRLI